MAAILINWLENGAGVSADFLPYVSICAAARSILQPKKDGRIWRFFDDPLHFRGNVPPQLTWDKLRRHSTTGLWLISDYTGKKRAPRPGACERCAYKHRAICEQENSIMLKFTNRLEFYSPGFFRFSVSIIAGIYM